MHAPLTAATLVFLCAWNIAVAFFVLNFVWNWARLYNIEVAKKAAIVAREADRRVERQRQENDHCS